ncbi:MFS transporter [Methanosarcina sp.]|uniref:MFS transporter n=1 Tax=Methanosarcina sp. TaxID=2213 RepID=UPI002AB93394|nr:MFS transporter [Methanosarcina sp.]MDY9926065.1 MFS transporter [Methanosarcina sp.]
METDSGTSSTDGKALFPLYTITFIGTLGFGIILTFLVFLVTEYGGNALVYGILASTYPAFQLIGAPILGRWSDLYGRKKILLLSQAGTLLAWVIFLVALFFPVIPLIEVRSDLLGIFTVTLPLLALFFARALDGITGGNVSVANAYLADLTSEEERNKNYGRMSVASNLGYVFGPALAGLLGATVYGELLPVSVALVISIIGTLIVLFLLPDSKPCEIEEYSESTGIRKVLGQEQKECYKIEAGSKITFGEVFKLEYIPFMLIVYFLIFLGFNIYYTAFPVFAVVALEWSPAELGVYFSVISALMAFVQGPVLAKLAKRYRESILVVVGGFILGLQFILIISGNIFLLYLAAVFFAFGNGIMWPSILSILSKFAGKKYQGSVQGFAMSASSLASIIGLLAGGLLYTQLGVISFLIAAAIIYLVVFLSFRLVKIEKERLAETAVAEI